MSTPTIKKVAPPKVAKAKNKPSIEVPLPEIHKTEAAPSVVGMQINTTGKTLGADNQIICSTFFVDSVGDLVKIGKQNGVTVVEIDLGAESLAKLDTVIVAETTNVNKPTIVRKRIPASNEPMKQICEVKLGFYRSRIDKIPNVLSMLKPVRTYYDKTTGAQVENDKAGNIDYRTMIMATDENAEAVAKLIKKLVADEKRATEVKWFV